MPSFEVAYQELNPAQRQAVDTIDGPVLVVAGPGTGKTQLLSMRVANIIRTTDLAPANILCLTFTDNAARNMRERLESIIGQSSYHIAIHTFHSFGGEVINQYAECFNQRLMLQQIDELGRYELLQQIFKTLPHSNPLSARVGDDFVFLKDSLQAISWLKQNGLTPAELREIIADNQRIMQATSKQLAAAFAATPSPKYIAVYTKLLKSLEAQASQTKLYGFPNFAQEAATTLAAAILEVPPNSRYAKSITAWRSAWCAKDSDGQHHFKDDGRNLKKMLAIADVYETLVSNMSAQGLYDFDDMIIEVVQAMEHDDELRLNLQERYQYILVDEFQDTNKAQLRILLALGDNPIFEQRPNIMAVGDDDQAIYAFQGAEVSNMVAFSRAYRQPTLITLQDNYRSTPQILSGIFAVAEQISDRLGSILPNTHNPLAAHINSSETTLEHNAFLSELSQYDWIAERIQQYIQDGIDPKNIAVLAPRHRYLERLMPYLLTDRQLPVSYERRADILESPIVLQLLGMAQLLVAISEDRHQDVDALLSQVLRYDFWQLPAEELVALSLDCYTSNRHWLEVALAQDGAPQVITQWLISLATRSKLEPLEYILDQLMGGLVEGIDSEYDELTTQGSTVPSFVSPMREFYFNDTNYEQATDSYLALLGQLSTLRQQLREWRPNQTLYITDLVTFAELHLAANVKIIDTNPHTQTTNAVQVMTAYKAKGLEFEVVFVINAQDEIWGPTARSRSPQITLPKNLPLAPASDGDDDKLRLFFVALSRAKQHLHITSYRQTLDNKLSPTLSFISPELHDGFVAQDSSVPVAPQVVEILTTDWAYRFRQVLADKPTLFEPILKHYKLSVTHLNNFIDVADAGPHYFLLHNLLRFPQAPTAAAAYGDAIHKSLQWLYSQFKASGSQPSLKAVADYFEDVLVRKHLKPHDHQQLTTRGKEALATYLADRSKLIEATDVIERGFNNEGVVVAGANLSGKIDKLQFIGSDQLAVVDFKTGKPATSWQSKDEYEKIKLYKYRQQLLFYKLLVENSASFSGKRTVASARLEFIETNQQAELVPDLTLEFDPQELQTFAALIGKIWQHIMTLNFPNTAAYSQNLKGIKQFEKDLLDGVI